jgi:hypothetical protein
MGLGGLGAPLGRQCRGDPAELADHMLVRIEHKVKPTDTQKGAFEEFKVAARSAADKIKSGCPKDVAAEVENDTQKPRTGLSPIERLSRTQIQLEASLEAVKTLRPAAEKFYASLSDEQKTKLTERRGWRHGKRADRKPDDTKAPAAPADEATPPSQQ